MKQPTCPLTDEWIKKMWCIYIYTQQNIIQPYKEGNPAICDNMDKWEGIMLSEISQADKGKYCMVSLIYGIFLKTPIS